MLGQESYRLPNPLLREFCFLQFRMICELIGFACITAHGEIADAKLRDQWAADAIMKQLAGLHPSFYPEPIVENAAPWPIKSDMTPFTGDYLTKADLIALNGKCGSILHQGSFKRLLTKKVPARHSHPEIQRLVTKITNLVQLHRVSLIRPGKLYLCQFLPDGRVNAFAAMAIGPIEPKPPT
ncbi:hypothetical protein ACVWXO_000091 [Bradyrhizobium sp. LM2.7]